jgi:hypothetical protein
MNISKSTESYEKWLSAQTPLVAKDVAIKHAQMALGVFEFFRATFYRWAQIWPELAGEAAEGPEVLAVGDLHLENFGTWRDAEGRLIWGVNDFDEVYELPYTFDLVRLAASVCLVRKAERLAIGQHEACKALLSGYGDALAAGGRPFVLGERHEWLSAIAHSELRNPVMFWQRLREAPAANDPISREARAALERLMPEPIPTYQVVQRVKGLGSLGHRRFIALAEYHGGMLAREAKALSASACVWAWDKKKPKLLGYSEMLARAVRCHDPLVRVEGAWLSRRLAPDCSRIELASLARVADEARLLRAMGWETANIHLGTEGAVKRIRRDLRSRPGDWLATTSKKLANAVSEDFEEWRSAARSETGE